MARKKAEEIKEKDNTKSKAKESDKKVKNEESKSESTSKEAKQDSSEESIEEQLEETKDRYLRLTAEFDNYRKRTLKEKMELTKTASEEIISKLLPVVDDFERGLISMETAKDINAVKEGILLIYNKLNDILKQQGVKVIEALEKDFDMDIHEAVTKIPAPNEELKGKVVDVIEKGYYLNEKIIRYPKVVVGE